MALVLSEEQQLLKESAAGFLAEKAPVSQLRQLRDDGDERGYKPELWQEMVDMGFAGLLVSEDHGGTGFGYVGAGIVMEEMGRRLSASPFFATGVVGAALLRESGDAAAQADLLPKLASGEVTMTLALDETPHFAPDKTAMSVAGGTLKGLKTFVPDACTADLIVVAARESGAPGDAGGLTLYLVDGGADHLIRDRVVSVDSRHWGKLTFEGVAPRGTLGAPGKGHAVLSAALDRVNMVLAAELVGVSLEAMDQTLTYLKERKQFDTTIGAFQALQHRVAHLFSEVEGARSAVLKGLQMADQGGDVGWFASLAKAKACKAAVLATNEAIQMHGGIGMTDEYDIGFYLKRARVIQQLYGDYGYHADRFAALSGY
ncbi:acyl-CoA dehydrogenase family protein [Yunchengibacter salinarum]|uniref:acyl-CoA dehydrogenase family protein n=1 Tax=Yunchengibacter salinarum TaxID=3133399 RepID=UPI0035B65A1D